MPKFRCAPCTIGDTDDLVHVASRVAYCNFHGIAFVDHPETSSNTNCRVSSAYETDLLLPCN